MSGDIILILVAFASLVVTAYMATQLVRLNKQSEQASAERAKVAEALVSTTAASDRKLDGLATVANSTHLLVNNAMSIQLHSNAVLARKLAALTGDASDMEAARAADEAYADHVAKQRAVDSLPGTDAEKAGRA